MIRIAFWILRRAMKKHPDYAWSWHCNLAMMAHDAGAPHKEANERAGDLMHQLFGIRPQEP